MLAFLLLIGQLWAASPIRVAVIDSGLDLTDARFSSHICPSGHKDFTGTGISDSLGHGTHVAGLIQKYAKTSNFCLVAVKYYSPTLSTDQNVDNFEKALQYVADLHVDFVNISGGGETPSPSEEKVIKKATDEVFVAAAGNNHDDLNAGQCGYFPACYKMSNIVSVGSLDASEKLIAPYSNYGARVSAWEVGENAYSTLPNGRAGFMSGTSMAAAIHTGKLVYEKSISN